MGDDQGHPDRLAAAIADGDEVDWAGEYARTDREPRLEQLCLIAAMSAAHRSWLEPQPPAPAPPAPAGAPVESISPAPPVTSSAGPVRIGHYHVECVLGRGGMGIVYLARDTRLDRRVAIKALPEELAHDPDGMRRFEREAKLLASISHPHIATVYGMELDERGARYLVMECLEGSSLSRRLEQGTPPLDEALALGAAIARALEAAHERGVIHRDLKPGNVMVGPRDLVKVLDFGLAKRVADPTDGAAVPTLPTLVTETLVRLGTPGYMAPEQVVGAPQDASADVFAFGCVLYECLAGKRALRGGNAAELLAAALVAAPDWGSLPAGTPRAVRALLRRCLEKDPLRRPAMGTARRELEQAMQALAARKIETQEIVEEPVVGAGPSDNLPRPMTSFIGRERDVTECLDALAEHRLLTLTGIGGCGKTRLALAVATELLDDRSHSVCFIDLAPLRESGEVAGAVARALDRRERPGRSALESVVDALRGRPMVLVLDNCEHVLPGAVDLAASLLPLESVRILATSREPLGLTDERVHAVPPLTAPPLENPGSAAEITRFEAVQLFVARARQVAPGLAFDEPTARAIARVCARLDGIPLALELVAARMRALSIQEIESKLEERFRLASGRSATFPERHQRLQSVIAWSYEHMNPDERRALRAFSVLAGAATLAAAGACIGADEFETLEVLTGLLERSLMLVERSASGESRYRMLETVREYARAELEASQERSLAEARHLEFYALLVKTAFDRLAGPEEAEAVRRIESEYSDLHLALVRCASSEEATMRGLRMAAQLGRYWYIRGELTLGGRELASVLALPGAQGRTAARAGALYAAGDLAVFRHDSAATSYFEEALVIYRELADEMGILRSLIGLGNDATERGDHATARVRIEECLASSRRLKSRRIEGLMLGNLAEIASRQGDLESAIRTSAEALSILAEGTDQHGLALTTNNHASYLVKAGEAVRARERLLEALTLFRELAAKRGAVYGVQTAAELALLRGEPATAACTLAAASMLREAIGMVMSPQETDEIGGLVARARSALGEASFEREWATGRALTFEQAMDRAIEWLEASR